jgi:GntR family transcriptional regulator, phosphonate transport system regulatory protein
MVDDLKTERTASPLRQGKGKVPLWRAICQRLEADIRESRLQPGQRLPSEEVLARDFLVHRNTVRHALEVLESKNLIRIEHGSGSFVRERIVLHSIGRNKTLLNILRDINRVGREKVIRSSTTRASGEIEASLRLKGNAYVRRVEIVSYVDERPVMVSTAYFPLPRFHGIEVAIVDTGTVPAALAKIGVTEFVRHETRITTSRPTRSDAAVLQQPRAQPVLKLTNLLKDQEGRPILLSRIRMAPRWVELVIRYDDF